MDRLLEKNPHIAKTQENKNKRREIQGVHSKAKRKLTFESILYADETLLVTKNARTMNILIKEIEIESEKYNMKLNKSKCNYNL